MSAETITADEPCRPVKLKVSTPADLVATLPYLFGFPPTDSIIVLALQGKRVVASARADAALVGEPDKIQQALSAITRQGDHLIVIAWIEPQKAAERAAVLVAAALGGVGQTIIVCGGRCRADGGPWQQCPASLPEAQEAGLEVLPSRAAVAAKVKGPPASDKQATRRWRLARSAVVGHDQEWCQARLDELLTHGIARPDRLSAYELTELAALVHDGVLRDRVWQFFDAARAGRLVVLWQSAVAVVARAGAPAPLGLLALAAWLHGEGALQTCCLERGLRIAPEHSLLRLVDQMMVAGLPPAMWPQIQHSLMSLE